MRSRALIEEVESRRLMSVSISGGLMTVVGTTGNDSMYLAWYVDPSTGAKSVRVSDGGAYLQYNVNSSLTSVSIYGSNGDDTINLAASSGGWANSSSALIPVTANGGAGGDTLYGSNAADTLYGGSSDDELYGYAGNDFLDGGLGADVEYGGDGVDTIECRNDSLAADSMNGGAGADRFFFNTKSTDPTFNYDIFITPDDYTGDQYFPTAV